MYSPIRKSWLPISLVLELQKKQPMPAKTIGGKLYRITPVTAYTSADLDWNNKSSRSSIEMTTENSRPELGGEALDLKDYDVVFLGYPIWWNLCPRPVNTFLEKYDFSR